MCLTVSVVGMTLLFVWLCPFTAAGFIVSLVKKKERREGRRKRKKQMPPAGFKLAKPFLLVFLAAAGWGVMGFTFLPSCGFGGCGPCVNHTLHSCPACSPVPQFTDRFSLAFCTRSTPSVHQLCSPWGAPIKDNSHTSFLLFAVLDTTDSQSLLRVVCLPHTELSLSGNCWRPEPCCCPLWLAFLPSSWLCRAGAPLWLWQRMQVHLLYCCSLGSGSEALCPRGLHAWLCSLSSASAAGVQSGDSDVWPSCGRERAAG